MPVSESSSDVSKVYIPHVLRAYDGQKDPQGFPDVLGAAREALDDEEMATLEGHVQHVRMDEASVPLSWLDRQGVSLNLAAASAHLDDILHVIGGTDLSCKEVADWLEDQLGEQDLTVAL